MAETQAPGLPFGIRAETVTVTSDFDKCARRPVCFQHGYRSVNRIALGDTAEIYLHTLFKE